MFPWGVVSLRLLLKSKAVSLAPRPCPVGCPRLSLSQIPHVPLVLLEECGSFEGTALVWRENPGGNMMETSAPLSWPGLCPPLRGLTALLRSFLTCAHEQAALSVQDAPGEAQMAGQQQNNAGTVNPLICLQHGHCQGLLGLLCSSLPSSSPSSCLQALQPHPCQSFPSRLSESLLPRCRAWLTDQSSALLP